MKFVLFVEGDTERKILPGFFKRWFDPRLPRPIGVDAISLNGWPNFVHQLPQRARATLMGPASDSVIAAVGLMDLYGPEFFPGSLRSAERIAWGTKKFQDEVDHPRFQMFFAVHETEAWLLSQPDIFPDGVKQQLSKYSERPESVNLTEPPSKLIDRAYQKEFRRPYKKTVDGADLFSRLDPDQARVKCRNLTSMLDSMLARAKGSRG